MVTYSRAVEQVISFIEHSMQKLRFYCKINEYQLSSKNKLGFPARILNINTVNGAKVLARPAPQLGKYFFHLISSKRNYCLYIIKNCTEVLDGKIWACTSVPCHH